MNRQECNQMIQNIAEGRISALQNALTDPSGVWIEKDGVLINQSNNMAVKRSEFSAFLEKSNATEVIVIPHNNRERCLIPKAIN